MNQNEIEEIKHQIDDMYDVSTHWIEGGFTFSKGIHEFNVFIFNVLLDNGYLLMYRNKKDNSGFSLSYRTSEEMFKKIDEYIKREPKQMKLF